MTKEEIKKIREQAVVETMHLLRTGKIGKHTSNSDVLMFVEMNLEKQVARLQLVGRNLDAIIAMRCVQRIYKNDRGWLMADVKKDPTGLCYEAHEGDYISCEITDGVMSDYGTVEPLDWRG